MQDPGPGKDAGWGTGLEQFLTTQYLPCLRELRLLCRQLPKISTDFINQLDAAQIDFPYPATIGQSLGEARQIGPFSAPVLFSFDGGFFNTGEAMRGIEFAHVRTRIAWELLEVIQLLPDLKALSFEISRPTFSTRDLGSLDHSSVADTIKNVKDMSIELFASGTEDDDFVDRGFLDFLRSHRMRT